MQTIRIPKNLLFLSDKLPQPNYDKSKKNNSFTNKNSNDLPDIRQINNKKKHKLKDIIQENLESSLAIDNIINPEISSIKKKSPNKENINSNNLISRQLNNPNQNEDENYGIKIVERKEKSPTL